MRRFEFPKKSIWSEICRRPEIEKNELAPRVKSILDKVKSNGDAALFDFSRTIDKVELDSLEVSTSEIDQAINLVSDDLKNAIQLASRNIEKFHRSQMENPRKIETTEGVVCWRKSVGIESVGLYIPGGTAPLFSTILMLAIPAKIADCKEIIMCTPPQKNGEINPVMLYTAKLVGVTKIFKTGGAQAIGAMAYGTESIPSVSKIFGPGNQYVTKAKELVLQEGVAIDMPAGPSEVLVIADRTCVPEFVAADLLSQAEHGIDSQVILLSDARGVLNEVERELELQLQRLPRKEIAQTALKNSRSVLCNDIRECFELSNSYAPEHLIIASANAENYVDEIINAGSVFLGNYSCESAGDYASGTNHTLPTNGFAKSYSGVSVDSFTRKITFQNLSEIGIKNIGPAIELMAEAEDLFAHKNAVTLRIKSPENV